ncbi:hypothetical protein M405DRAFT_885445 [Rhizopogon salebrosus TDB-379]|nr:hypothetical protein M405DRAFT_885445 [Rhizopogon salebrosus TDB-379]
MTKAIPSGRYYIQNVGQPGSLITFRDGIVGFPDVVDARNIWDVEVTNLSDYEIKLTISDAGFRLGADNCGQLVFYPGGTHEWIGSHRSHGRLNGWFIKDPCSNRGLYLRDGDTGTEVTLIGSEYTDSGSLWYLREITDN